MITQGEPPASSGDAGPRIISVKLQPPRCHVASVERSLIGRQLGELPPGGVALVCAAAGYGKTTAIAAAVENNETPVAWLTIDQLDSNPVRFWQHLWASCALALPDESADPSLFDHIRPSDIQHLVIPTVLNALAESARPVTIVLDDLHLIADSAVVDHLDYVLERLPNQARIILASRTDPPVNLARLRVRGALVEIRVEQLSFTRNEAATFLNHNLDLGLSRSSLARLFDRTEGWPAGLYLAALTLQGRPERDSLVERFAGDSTITADYLASEVLAHLDYETTEFLLRTSILDRFNTDLALAVSDIVESARCIRELVSSNMFVQPIDTSNGDWHRIHPLFRDLLRRRLGELEPDLAPKLHCRAVQWYLTNNQIADALHHAVAVPDLALVTNLLNDHWIRLVATGDFETMRIALTSLNPASTNGEIGIKFAEASVAMHDSRDTDATRALTEIEQLDTGGDYGVLTAVFRACLELQNGSTAGPYTTLTAITDQDSGCILARPIAWLHAGSAALWAGDLDVARSRLENTLARLPTSQALARATASGHLAVALAEQLELDRAEEVALDGIAAARRTGVAHMPEAALLHAALGLVMRRRGKIEQAMTSLEHATRHIQRAGPLRAAYALLLHAGTARRAGEPDLARALVAQAREQLAPCPDPGPVLARTWERESRSLRTLSHGSMELPEGLTQRELEQLRLLPTEMTQREMAEHLIISFNTVKTNNRAIYRKLGVSNRREAIATAQDLGLI